jgi:hypothetical protein
VQFSRSAEATCGGLPHGGLSKLSSASPAARGHRRRARSTFRDRPAPGRARSLGHRERRPCELPRKEVIQPQLPLRLPCYDFTPITSPTFDGSLPCGLGDRLRVLPAFVV